MFYHLLGGIDILYEKDVLLSILGLETERAELTCNLGHIFHKNTRLILDNRIIMCYT